MNQNIPQPPSSGKGPLYAIIAVLATLLVVIVVSITIYVVVDSKHEQTQALENLQKELDDLKDSQEEKEEPSNEKKEVPRKLGVKLPVRKGESKAPAKEKSTNAKPSTSLTGVFYGTIGDDPSAVLTLNNGVGTYSYYNGSVVRNIQVQSYSPSGAVLIYAYDRSNGSYVGRLDGTMSNGRIKGVFTNYKGAKVNFDMR